MRALLAIFACMCLQACAQEDELGKSSQASAAPMENASFDAVGDNVTNGA